MSDGIATRILGTDDPMYALAIDMIEAMRAATTPYVELAGDPRDGLSALMTAANMFAGAQFGTLLVLGAVNQQDTRRAAEAASRNFREGVKIGTRRATRVAREGCGGTA